MRIRTDGHELLVDGEPGDVDKVARLIDQLGALLRDGYKFSKGDVQRAARLVAQDETLDLGDYFLRNVVRPSSKRQVVPKSINQRAYLDAIEQFDIVFGIGPAGTARPIWPWPRRCRFS